MPLVGTSSPPRILSSVLLPLPEGPSSTTNSPAYKIQVDAAQRVHVDLAHVIDLRQAAAANTTSGCPVAGGVAGVFEESKLIRPNVSQMFVQ